MQTYHLFISHSWRYSDAYEKIINLLNNQASPGTFNYKNYSIPKNDRFAEVTIHTPENLNHGMLSQFN